MELNTQRVARWGGGGGGIILNFGWLYVDSKYVTCRFFGTKTNVFAVEHRWRIQHLCIFLSIFVFKQILYGKSLQKWVLMRLLNDILFHIMIQYKWNLAINLGQIWGSQCFRGALIFILSCLGGGGGLPF